MGIKNLLSSLIGINCLFVLVILATSCKPSKNELFEFNPLDLVEREILLSEIADEISYVPLDNKIPIGQNPVIKFVDGFFYVSDSENGLMVFSERGEFIRRIGQKGRGPGEYRFSRTFTIDGVTGTIYVKDLENIIRYSNDGEFMGNLRLDQYAGSIDFIQIYGPYLFAPYNIQYSEGSEFEWVIYDTLGNAVKKKEMSLPPFKSNYLAGGGSYLFDDNLYFWNQFLDTVYKIKPDLTAEPSFIILSGEYSLPKTYIPDPIGGIPQFMFIDNIMQTKHFIMLNFAQFGKFNGFVLVDKKTGKSSLYCSEPDKTGFILNDIDGGVGFLPRYYYEENGREFLLGVTDPYPLKNHVASDDFKNSSPEFPEKKEQLKGIADNLEDTDNPVLIVVKLKN